MNRPRDDRRAFVEIVDRWRAKNPDLVVVPGNHDPDEGHAWEDVRVHERRGLRILAVPVIPLLCKIPTWTHEHTEARIAAMLDPFRGASFDVIASHGPPRGVCDRTVRGLAIGSTALRAFSADVAFRLWVCAHVHEQRGARGVLAGRPVLGAARTILDRVLAERPGAQEVAGVRTA